MPSRTKTIPEPPAPAPENEYLSTRQAADLLNVSVSTVQKMVEAGQLQAWKTKGGHRRILASALSGIARPRRPGDWASNVSNVLVVEDNAAMITFYQKLFAKEERRAHVTYASDAAEALLLIERNRPSLIITDLLMEPFDGFHLLRVLRKSAEFRQIRILVVTGMTPAAIEAKGGLPPGVVMYRKPVSMERIEGYLDAYQQERDLLAPPPH
jgi:excisionase family DNA binding protein